MIKLDLFSLEGKVAIVTGCSNGIGAGITRGLAEAGADIFGVYNSSAPVETEAQVTAMGRKFFSEKADMAADDFDASRIIEACVARYGRVDILVNNAGVCLRAPAIEHSRDMWDTTMRVNITAVYALSQAAAKQFVAQGSQGKIINLASMLSYHGGQNVVSYTASKHAVVGITRALASDLGRYGINVNALAPGWIKTNLSAPIYNNPERSPAITARIPLGDWGEPDYFKGAAVFLASQASDYLTGVTIPVDGGYLVR